MNVADMLQARVEQLGLKAADLKPHAPELDQTKIASFLGRPPGDIDGVAAEVIDELLRRGIRPNPELFYTRVLEHGLHGVQLNRDKLRMKGYEITFEVGPGHCVMHVPKKVRLDHERQERAEASSRREASFSDDETAAIQISEGTVKVSVKEEIAKARVRGGQGVL